MHILIVMTYLLSASEQTSFFFLSVEKKNGVIRKDAQNHEKSDVKSKAETKSELATDVENPKAEAGNQAEV